MAGYNPVSLACGTSNFHPDKCQEDAPLAGNNQPICPNCGTCSNPKVCQGCGYCHTCGKYHYYLKAQLWPVPYIYYWPVYPIQTQPSWFVYNGPLANSGTITFATSTN